MKPFRFLQFSDSHADSVLTHSQLGWPPGKREPRIQEINALVPKLCRRAQDRQVEAIFIPGDLWDDETVSAETAALFIEAFARIAPLPVFIAPGNHDFWSRRSFYNNEILDVRGMPSWPQNVFIFQSDQFETIPHPTRPEVSITGRAFLQDATVTEHLLAQPLPNSEAEIRVLLFHGSLLEYEGKDARSAGKITAPFSGQELMEQDFSYAALGHYHHHTELLDGNDRIRAAYAGSLAGRTPLESGHCYALVGEMDAQGVCESLEKIRVDERIVYDLEVDVSDSEADSVIERVGQKLRDCGATSADIVYLQLKGRRAPGEQTDGIASHFRDQYFYFSVSDQTRPTYHLERSDTQTTEERFIQELKQLTERATNEQERVCLSRALDYGLDALLQGKVKPAYED